jgi:hypothetical protein
MVFQNDMRKGWRRLVRKKETNEKGMLTLNLEVLLLGSCKNRLFSVLDDDDRSSMHQFTHLHISHLPLLTKRLQPFIERPRNIPQTVGPTTRHDTIDFENMNK